MTLWEFGACVEGYREMHGGEQEVDAPSYEEHLAMVSRIAKQNGK